MYISLAVVTLGVSEYKLSGKHLLFFANCILSYKLLDSPKVWSERYTSFWLPCSGLCYPDFHCTWQYAFSLTVQQLKPNVSDLPDRMTTNATRWAQIAMLFWYGHHSCNSEESEYI